MADVIKLEVKTAPVKRMTRDVSRRAANPRPAFRSFHTYMRQQTDFTFRIVGNGGKFRGVKWDGFADQYTRKGGHDGTGDKSTVPAEGGIPRVNRRRTQTGASAGRLRRGGKVKGRLRPSGKRVTAKSKLLRDAGVLSAQAGQLHKIIIGSGKSTLLMFVDVDYGKRLQQGDAAAGLPPRPFLFFQRRVDDRVFREMLLNYILGVSPTLTGGRRVPRTLFTRGAA